MCWISRNLVMILLCMCIMLAGVVPVLAEDKAENATNVEEITVPVEGVTTFKYSPAGFQLTQPDGVTATVSEFSGHQLVMFLSENQSILSVDALASNMTLAESIVDQKSKIESKKDYSLISEGNISLGGEPAFFVNFKYLDDLGSEKLINETIAVNSGFAYVLMSDLNVTESAKTQASEMVSSFEYIPVGEDAISKMVKTKMQRMTEPDKGYRHYSYSYSYSYYYSWDYYYDWCYCNSRYMNYYCWCW